MVQRQKREQGFTIIEVLIVLAIAALILLIVLLAVPALNRNAHNTSAKNDVSGLMGAMNEYVNNNGGTPAPLSTVGTETGTTYYVGGTSTSCATAGKNCATAKLGYYTADKISIASSIPGTFPAVGNVSIIEGAVCNSNGTAATTSGATTRNFAAEFTLEGGAQECVQGS